MKQIYVAFKNWTGGHNLIASLCFCGLGGAWHGICNVSSAKRVLVFSPKHPSEFFVANGFSRRRIYIDDVTRIEASGIAQRTQTMKRCFGTDLLIVDAVDRIGDILPELRDLAIELKIPVVITEERAQEGIQIERLEVAEAEVEVL